MAKLKIVPNDLPDADGKWIDVPNEIVVPGEEGWWMEMIKSYAQYVPDGYHIVQFENPGRTRIDEIGSRRGH